MAKRLGGVLLGVGVNIVGEFCISYNVRLGGICARAQSSHINTPSYKTKLVQVCEVQAGSVSASVYDGRGGGVLGKVVGDIVFTGTPLNYELALLDSVTDTVKAHIYGFGATLFDCFIGDGSCACIVDLDGCGRLRVSHLFESDAERDTVASILEDGAELCFCGRCHDIAHDGADGVDGAVVWLRCGGRTGYG
jgi:hypothetical protein